MNTSVQHPINLTNTPQGVGSVSPQNSQIESIQGAITDIRGNVEKAIEQMKQRREEFLASQYFEVAGHHLELQNHGSPQCKSIAINEQVFSRSRAQAWSNEINGIEHWYYNYPGATREAEFLGKKIPTIEEWMKMLASVNGNAEEKAQALNISLVGCCDQINGSGKLFNVGVYANFWSSSPEDNANAHFASFRRGDPDTTVDVSDCRRAMSLRFLSDIK